LVKRIPLKQGGERREREKREGAERERERERENKEARNRTDETRNYISKRTRRDTQIWETKATGCDSTGRDKRSTDGLMD
jgi:hypothetical protein